MTDRAQPGAIDSVVRNDELAQVLSAFNDGYIVPATEPTPAAQRRSNIDDTALDAFALSTSGSSLDVSVAPGEAFVGGWCVRDVSTTLTLPPNATVRIVVGWNPDAAYDPDTDADRDAADETIVDLRQNVAELYPFLTAWQVKTGDAGVSAASRVASVGLPQSGAGAGEILAFEYLNPSQ